MSRKRMRAAGVFLIGLTGFVGIAGNALADPPVPTEIEGDLDVFGNHFSLGVWSDDEEEAGFTLSYTDGSTLNSPAMLRFATSRPYVQWLWEHENSARSALVPMMRLDSSHRLNLYSTSDANTPKIILDPELGRISINGVSLNHGTGFNRLTVGSGATAVEGSIAVGEEAMASGTYSLALGWGAIASGENSFALGYLASATGEGAISLGSGPADGRGAVTLGGGVPQALGDFSVAMGHFTYAGGAAATAVGKYTTANAEASMAMGWGSEADGWAATAAGARTWAVGSCSFVIGFYNVQSWDDFQGEIMNDYGVVTPQLDRSHLLFIIGNGTSVNPSNAFTVNVGGDVVAQGQVAAAGITTSGTSEFNGPTRFNGSVRMAPQGDILMGEFGQEPGTP